MNPSEMRLTLCQHGYTPVPLYGKTPPVFRKNNSRKGMADWQRLDNVSREQIEMWGKTWPDAINTGILTRLTPTLDLDILNEEAARAVEDMVRERFEERGYVLTRIGLPPKRAMLFRTTEPFAKITVNFVSAKGEKIEFMGDGQQIVADGIHPDTKNHIAGSVAIRLRSRMMTCPTSARTKPMRWSRTSSPCSLATSVTCAPASGRRAMAAKAPAPPTGNT
jgi:Bifunctional DNA primase/polymerase, N-terminal